MYHELFGPRGAEDERGDFWTSIPEGGDMLPGMLPGEDHTEAPGAARSHRHAHQAGDVTPQEIDELRQALDPQVDPAVFGEDPEHQPQVRAHDADSQNSQMSEDPQV